jgi:para-nitrobenzyl esterase
MRHIITACAAALMLANISPACAESDAPAAKYSSSTTQMGALLADPAAKAVLTKHLPRLVESPDMAERASGMTLKEMQEALKAYAPDLLSDEVLATIDQELAALPGQN